MAHFTIAQGLGSAISIRRRFDPEATLQAIDEHKPTALAVVPVMLQRILELPDDVRQRYDTSSLKVIAASGSALTGKLATRVMDEFGDVLYNLYGSTEVAVATVATPEDMRAAPDTAGQPPVGTTVKILDDKGNELPVGATGRIFVGNEMMFDGYTGGGNKEVIGGLMSSGDVGHFDENGRLFVEGRDDEMIVSGGENVFPAEVEELLGAHEAVAEVAVIGVDDEKFGKRLKAFVVTREGASLGDDDVKNYVRDHLARYKIPRDVEFLDELPRNSTGKILKRELIEREKEESGKG
jgi:fatty-acyl-CoA synthase